MPATSSLKSNIRVGNLNNSNLAFFTKAQVIMKKAKLMLTGIAILAVVGGALAFKAKSSYSGTFVCTANADFQGEKTVFETYYQLANVGVKLYCTQNTTYEDLTSGEFPAISTTVEAAQ
jgi:hypothetical protein